MSCTSDKTKIQLSLRNTKPLCVCTVFHGVCGLFPLYKQAKKQLPKRHWWQVLEFTEFSLMSEQWDFWWSPFVEQPRALSIFHVGFRPPSLPVTQAPVGGRVPNQVLLHNIDVAFFLDAASQDFQHQSEPAVHCLKVRLDEDGGQSVTEQRLLHQGAQLVVLFGQQLETQVGGFSQPGDERLIIFQQYSNLIKFQTCRLSLISSDRPSPSSSAKSADLKPAYVIWWLSWPPSLHPISRPHTRCSV